MLVPRTLLPCPVNLGAIAARLCFSFSQVHIVYVLILLSDFLLVPLSLTKEPAQLSTVLPDQPDEQLCSEDLGWGVSSPYRGCKCWSEKGCRNSSGELQELEIALWKSPCRASGRRGCFESGRGLLKWQECCLSQRLSCRCQRASKAAVGDESICTVPCQQGVWIAPNQSVMLCQSNCPETAQDGVSCNLGVN